MSQEVPHSLVNLVAYLLLVGLDHRNERIGVVVGADADDAVAVAG